MDDNTTQQTTTETVQTPGATVTETTTTEQPDTETVTVVNNPQEKLTVKFIGADGSEGYVNGQVYTLNKWEENGMVFVSREDGNGQVAYDSMDSLMQNWEVQPEVVSETTTVLEE